MNKRRLGNGIVSSSKARGGETGVYVRGSDRGQPFNLDPLFEKKGNGNCGGSYSNKLEKHHNLFYCPNKGCGYDINHNGYKCPYAAPWDIKSDVTHFHGREGASMKGKHKILASRMGAGIGWHLAGQITQVQ